MEARSGAPKEKDEPLEGDLSEEYLTRLEHDRDWGQKPLVGAIRALTAERNKLRAGLERIAGEGWYYTADAQAYAEKVLGYKVEPSPIQPHVWRVMYKGEIVAEAENLGDTLRQLREQGIERGLVIKAIPKQPEGAATPPAPPEP